MMERIVVAEGENLYGVARGNMGGGDERYLQTDIRGLALYILGIFDAQTSPGGRRLGIEDVQNLSPDSEEHRDLIHLGAPMDYSDYKKLIDYLKGDLGPTSDRP